jgi:hypothetical protein
MRRAIVCAIVTLACGPSVGSSDDESTSGDATTGTGATATVSTTIDPTNGTSATTAGTSATTASTSTSTTTTGGTFEDTSDETTFSFILDPDGGGGACLAMSWCDIWAQDCPRGEKCMPWDLCGTGDWSGTHCSELDPNPASIGDSCTVIDGLFAGADDCEITSMCWNPDPDTLEGVCVAFCSGSEANPLCEDPATTCFLGFNNNVLSVCLPRCDPSASLCAASESCIFDEGSEDGAFVCMPSNVVAPQAYGDDCTEAVACGTGLLCLDAEHVPSCVGERCCTTLGDAMAPPVCPDATQTCLPLYDGVAPEGLEDLCFCGVPE